MARRNPGRGQSVQLGKGGKVAGERIKFADGATDDVPAEMAEFMLRDIFRKRRGLFASTARAYYLALHGGQETADEMAEE